MMPVISMFYFDNKQHSLPHIHIEFAEWTYYKLDLSATIFGTLAKNVD